MARKFSYSLRVGFTVGSGSGRPVFAVRVSGWFVGYFVGSVGLTVYIRPDVHLYSTTIIPDIIDVHIGPFI